MWEERYSAKEYAYGKDPNDFLVEQVNQLFGFSNEASFNQDVRSQHRQRVLCLAEGEGRNAVYLAKQGFDVTAVDSSKAGMEKAQKLATENNVSIEAVVSDLSEFEFVPESYDIVVSIFCHIPLSLRQNIHKQVVRALKPGGVFIVEAYTPEQLKFKTGGPAIAELTVQLQDLLEEIQSLDVVHSAEKEREVIEGLYHTGMGAVVQLVARKPE